MLDTPADWLAISLARGGLVVNGCRENDPREARVALEAGRLPDGVAGVDRLNSNSCLLGTTEPKLMFWLCLTAAAAIALNSDIGGGAGVLRQLSVMGLIRLFCVGMPEEESVTS